MRHDERLALLAEIAASGDAEAWFRELERSWAIEPNRALVVLRGLRHVAGYGPRVAPFARRLAQNDPEAWAVDHALFDKRPRAEMLGRALDDARRRGRGRSFVRALAQAWNEVAAGARPVGLVRVLVGGGRAGRQLAALLFGETAVGELDAVLRRALVRLVLDPRADVWGPAAAAWGLHAAGHRTLLDSLLGTFASGWMSLIDSGEDPSQRATSASRASTVMVESGEWVSVEGEEDQRGRPGSIGHGVARRALAALGGLARLQPDCPISWRDGTTETAAAAFRRVLLAKNGDPHDQAAAIFGLLWTDDADLMLAVADHAIARRLVAALGNLAFILTWRDGDAHAIVASRLLAAIDRLPADGDGSLPELVVRLHDGLRTGSVDGRQPVEPGGGAGGELAPFLYLRDVLFGGVQPPPRAQGPEERGVARVAALSQLVEAATAAHRRGEADEEEGAIHVARLGLALGAAGISPSDPSDLPRRWAAAVDDLLREVDDGLPRGSDRGALGATTWALRRAFRAAVRVATEGDASASTVTPIDIVTRLAESTARALREGTKATALPLLRCTIDVLAEAPALVKEDLGLVILLFADAWSPPRSLVRPVRREVARLLAFVLDRRAPSSRDAPDRAVTALLNAVAEHPLNDGELQAEVLDRLATREARNLVLRSSLGRPNLRRRAGEAYAALSAPTDASNRPGWIEGQYEIVRRLGRGGFGVVYECENAARGRVAVKVCLDPWNKGRHFLDEAVNMTQLVHPAVPRLLGLGHHGPYPYFAQDFIDGMTLQQRMRRGPLPEAECRRILLELAEVLVHAHGRNLVHRDLKPANVMVTAEDGSVRVLDWGLAFPGEIMTEGYARGGGTPRYGAPEQFCPSPAADPPVDAFAFGRLAAELLAGRPLADLLSEGALEAPAVFTAEELVAAGVARPVADAVVAMATIDRTRRLSSFERMLDLLRGPLPIVDRQ